MVNYGDLQFAERIMVARRSEMSAEWKVRFAICNNINERLQDIHNIQSLKLPEKQRKKFFRDGINPNKNIPSELSVTSGETTRRKRRFSRHKEINRDHQKI